MKRWRAEAALVFNTIVWGATFVVVKEALAGISTILFLALRFSLAAVVLALFYRRAWSNPRGGRRAVTGGMAAGAFLFAAYLLQTFGLRFTTPPKSAFITGFTTVMVPLLGIAVYRNRPRWVEVAGVLLATLGMGLMTLEGSTWTIAFGDLLTIGCAMAFAAHILVVGHYSAEVGFELLSMIQIGTAALLSLGLFWWAETPVVHWSPAVVWAVLITGLLATALAFTVQAWAQRYTTSTRTAVIYTLEPVFAWITSYLLTGESLSGRAAGGAVLILSGILVVEMKPMAQRQHQPT